MLYPRENNRGELVDEAQIVGYREHLERNCRIVFLSGAIGQRCLTCGWPDTEAHNVLLALDSISHAPIHIIITSPGGDLDATFLLYDTIRLIKSPIETLGRYCASAAALILASGQKRYLLPHAKVMLHRPWGRREGDSRDWEIQGAEMKKYEDGFISALLDCGATKSYEEILNDIDRDLWLEPLAAIAYGLADGIMTPEVMENWLGQKENGCSLNYEGIAIPWTPQEEE